MHLTLTKRPAMLGGSINTRSEKHGDDDVPACDIPISGVLLSRLELNMLANDLGLYDALFRKGEGGVDEPVLRRFKPLVFDEKFEGCTVTVIAGLTATQFMLDDVRIAKIKLEPQAGGLTALSMQVQVLAEGVDVTALLSWMNHEIDVEVQFGRIEEGKKKQGELPLNTVGDNDDDREHAGTAH